MRFSPAQLVTAACLMIGMTVAGSAIRARDHAALQAARDDAHVARLALESASVKAAFASAVADNANQRAQRAEQHEQQSTQRADSATRTLTVLRERYSVSSKAAPDTCAPVIAAADSALAASDSAAASLRQALGAADERAGILQFGLDTARTALADLRAAAARSAVATAMLEHRSSPSFLSRLANMEPRMGVGAVAGVDLFGHPNAVIGVTFGWGF